MEGYFFDYALKENIKYEDVLLHDEISKEEYISTVCVVIKKYLQKDHNEQLKEMGSFFYIKKGYKPFLLSKKNV